MRKKEREGQKITKMKRQADRERRRDLDLVQSRKRKMRVDDGRDGREKEKG